MDIVTGIIFGGIVFLYLISLIKGFKLSKREEYIKSFESLNLSIQEACNSISQTTTGIEMIGEIREETNYILNELYPLSI